MKEGTVNVPGGRVWYGVHGEGAMPLLCLHGGPGFPHDYLEPLAELADDRGVIFYDQLGCGRSERPPDESLWTLDRSLEEVERVRGGLALDGFYVFGSSWGGLLAIEYALTKPAGLRGLILASPLVSVPRWVEDSARLKDALPGDVKATIDRHEGCGFLDCPEYVAATLVFWKRHVCTLDPWPDELERAFAGFGLGPYRTMWGPSEFTQTGNLRGRDPSRRLGELAVPVLWTCGRSDEATPESTEAFHAVTPHSEFVVFERSSHTAHLEEREQYVAVLRDFLRRADQALA
ncbi:MAG: proline iminopeptidase-family hydrolase [Actinomycetota bacterium]|nr:proline iminopeptidase-family hydrolase [Actinomycetota bacterium]